MGKVRGTIQALRKAGRLPDDVQERLDRQHGRISDMERELSRIGPQVAALEQRLEDLAEQLSPVDPGSTDDRADARSLLEEVRREHAQVRARITAATVFEERLRVLEERAGLDSSTGRPLR